jgi:hypothetical protein
MDRIQTFVGQNILEWDFSKPDQNTMVALSKICAAVLGTGGAVNGLACTQTTVPSMQVSIGQGELYQLNSLEATTSGTLPADTTNQILKQGILLGSAAPVNLPSSSTFAAPGTAGQSINYLIEAQYQDQDVSVDPTTGATPVVLNFYNSSNPATPWSGPGNSGTSSNTFRKGIIAFQVKAGSAATTGTQTTPSPDSGWIGLWVVTVANGQVSILNSNIATYASAPFINSTILGQTPVFTVPVGVAPATSSTQAPQLGQVLSTYAVRGLAGANNAGTPNTQFDFKADAVAFRNPTTGATAVVANVTTITNNVLTAGPAANGRDQAGAFSASSWVHFYFIYNGSTVATLSSASAPPTGPTLPAGYTSWAYIGALYFNGSSVLANGFFRGSWFRYKTPVVIVSGGTQTLRTAVSLTAVVPPNALQLQPRVGNFQVQSNGSGTYLASVILEVVTAFTAYQWGIGGTAGFNLNMFGWGGTCVLPNVGQNLNYYIVVTTGSAQSVDLTIDGYGNPNGGE